MFDKFDVEVHGDIEARWLDEVEPYIVTKTRALVRQAGDEVVEGAIGLIKASPRSGRVYQYGRASAPGEAPANQSGRLVASAFVNLDGDAMHVRAGFGVDYSRYLEGGTRHMAPRPFFGAPADKAADAFYDRMQQMVNEL